MEMNKKQCDDTSEEKKNKKEKKHLRTFKKGEKSEKKEMCRHFFSLQCSVKLNWWMSFWIGEFVECCWVS